ncbi:MAG: hypothetical protein M3Y33_05080 [Actinomycetota bacterium]|nr:hypothetical protein [Actinomycetota bacterium]
MEHSPLEDKTLAGGFEVMRLFTEAHLAVRTARETRRADVTDADGDARVTAEGGKEHTRTMVYGPVRTSRTGTTPRSTRSPPGPPATRCRC